MEKSNKFMYFSIVALVFVAFYFGEGILTGSGTENAISDTMQSIVLVGLASVLTWAVIREQKKKGRLSA